MTAMLFIGFIAMILLRVPVAMAIGAAVMMAFATSDFSDSFYIIPQQILDGVNKPSLAAVPFFIMAGNLMNVVGMTDRIFTFANALVGHFKAGLAQVNVLASMIFAGVSGAAVADCAGLGAIEIKAMRERGYKPEFAAAVTVCSAVVGPIIPPSIGLVIYAFLAQQSVERMFLAGVVPGVIIGASLMIFNRILAIRHDFPTQPKASRREVLRSGWDGILALIAPGIILGLPLLAVPGLRLQDTYIAAPDEGTDRNHDDDHCHHDHHRLLHCHGLVTGDRTGSAATGRSDLLCHGITDRLSGACPCLRAADRLCG